MRQARVYGQGSSVREHDYTAGPSLDAIRLVRLLAFTALGVVLLAATAVALVETRWTRRFEAPYPAIAASTDPGTIAAGEYLVYQAAACAYCHVPRERWSDLASGQRLALTGDHVFPLPFGRVYSANITPDRATGIGGRSDGELARVLRHGVRADGRAAVPLMEFQLSDEDTIAALSYLRSREPIAQSVPEHELTLLGKALMAFAIAPSAPTETARHVSPKGPTVERGAYLANQVSSCFACHTNRGPDGP